MIPPRPRATVPGVKLGVVARRALSTYAQLLNAEPDTDEDRFLSALLYVQIMNIPSDQLASYNFKVVEMVRAKFPVR